jgi:hypothetical protein
MKFILDFDEVIFNTRKLKEKMAELGIDESQRSGTTFEEIERQDPDFKIEDLVFEDALHFIQRHKGNCEIVSSFNSVVSLNNQDAHTQEEFQIEKILQSGVTELVGENHVHVVGESKKDILTKLQKQFSENGEECVFVDDRKEYVHEAENLGMKAFVMNRKNDTWSFEGSYERNEKGEVSSFVELENILKTWEK